MLDAAEKEMAKLKDEFLSAEHYLLALAGSKGSGGKVTEGSRRDARQADAGACNRCAARSG